MTLTIAQLDVEIAITKRDLAELIQQRRQLTRRAKAPNLTTGHKAAGLVEALKAGQLKLSELAPRAGMTYHQASVHLSYMYAAGQVERIARGVYRLPAQRGESAV